ncbi:hypothetical protein C1H46_005251 [Malus baccata]|uniref:Uncharacterized protein n=1 Tax=Malus baccata TaxID=106549 RepID=A0A540NDK4_MALBA|nr:hypothetical protein C1H46_005251 [Malus baccata]
MPSSHDSPPVLPIMSSDHHHIILAVKNTTIIQQIPRNYVGFQFGNLGFLGL